MFGSVTPDNIIWYMMRNETTWNQVSSGNQESKLEREDKQREQQRPA